MILKYCRKILRLKNFVNKFFQYVLEDFKYSWFMYVKKCLFKILKEVGRRK